MHPPIQFFTMSQVMFVLLNYGSSAADELEDQSDHRQNQQNVNESTQRVATHYSEQPEHQKDYKKRPKHLVTSASKFSSCL
jgi:hypothetical protein